MRVCLYVLHRRSDAIGLPRNGLRNALTFP